MLTIWDERTAHTNNRKNIEIGSIIKRNFNDVEYVHWWCVSHVRCTRYTFQFRHVFVGFEYKWFRHSFATNIAELIHPICRNMPFGDQTHSTNFVRCLKVLKRYLNECCMNGTLEQFSFFFGREVVSLPFFLFDSHSLSLFLSLTPTTLHRLNSICNLRTVPFWTMCNWMCKQWIKTQETIVCSLLHANSGMWL